MDRKKRYANSRSTLNYLPMPGSIKDSRREEKKEGGFHNQQGDH